MSGTRERRWHPLLEQWSLIAAASANRPWSGATAGGERDATPAHDPGCYLCPRVERASGDTNPDYRGPFAFDNDFPSLAPDQASGADASADDDQGLLRRASSRGRNRVLCWSERHDATLASLDESTLDAVMQLWQREYRTLAADPAIAFVQIFENKGREIGVSNLHPHGQIYATNFVTDYGSRLRRSQARWAAEHDDASLLGDLLAVEHETDERLVERGEHWSVFVPFAARFAYETWIVPHTAIGSIDAASDSARMELVSMFRRQSRRYDVLFGRSSPNITMLYNAPCDDDPDNAHWRFHIVFQPPLREPDKLKYLAGFESASGNIVNPLAPEVAAARLRAVDLTEWDALGLAL